MGVKEIYKGSFDFTKVLEEPIAKTCCDFQRNSSVDIIEEKLCSCYPLPHHHECRMRKFIRIYKIAEIIKDLDALRLLLLNVFHCVFYSLVYFCLFILFLF